jgi:hypothetical protein
MVRNTYESLTRVATTRKMIGSTQTTQVADEIAVRREEIAVTKHSAILTWLRLVTPTDATTGMMIGMMTGATTDATIVGITIEVDLEAVEVAGGTALRGYPTYHSWSN